MKEEIKVRYPSEDEIREQVDFIVVHATPQTQMAESNLIQMYRQVYLALKLSYKQVALSLSSRYNLQQNLDAIVVGMMIIFGLLAPSTS